MSKHLSFLVIALAIASSPARAEPVDDTPLARAMKDELARSKTLVMEGAARPYYVAYQVSDATLVEIVSEFGGVVQDDRDHRRALRINLRVGDHTFDSGNFDGRDLYSGTLPLDDDYGVLRRQMWLATDEAYKRSAEALEKKRAGLANQTREKIDSFSAEKPARIVSDGKPVALDADRLRALAIRMSSVLRDVPEVHEGGVIVSAVSERRYFADTDGGFQVQPRSAVTVTVVCRTQADDGMPLVNFGRVVASSPDKLPSEAELVAETKRVAAELVALRAAPKLGSYNGPVLFEGAAAGQVMRALLAGNLSGTPAPSASPFGRFGGEGGGPDSAFGSKIGKPVLPKGFSVVDDPTVDRLGNLRLVGGYAVDDEGVPAQKVALVEKGTLKRLLMSRTPRKDVPSSNGHGRAQGGSVRAHIGNLVVDASGGLARAALKSRLIKAARAEGESYGVIVRLIEDRSATGAYGGSTDPISFARGSRGRSRAALVVLKVTPDGKETLVRGAGIEMLQPSALRDIVATSRERVVHSSVGPVASSLVTPALLFEKVEISESTGPQTKPPSIPMPGQTPR
jgi:TldD protein